MSYSAIHHFDIQTLDPEMSTSPGPQNTIWMLFQIFYRKFYLFISN